jgi:hypothetical protein
MATRVYSGGSGDGDSMDVDPSSEAVAAAAQDLLNISFGPLTTTRRKKFQDLLLQEYEASTTTVTPKTNVIMDEEFEENNTSSMYLMMRRQRNRVSCRKARLKRKKEMRNIEILVSKREERRTFLLLFLERLKNASSVSIQDTQVRGFLARNLHYALCDEEYEIPSSMTKDPNHECTLVFTLMPMFLTQWQAIKEPYENVDFFLDDVYENHAEDKGEYEVTCQWHFLTSGTIPTSNNNKHQLYANGKTHIRFHDKLVLQIQMELLSVRPMEMNSNHSSFSSSSTSPYLYHQQQDYHVCDIVQV